jgi:galactokinase
MSRQSQTSEEWLASLASPDGAVRRVLTSCYGTDLRLLEDRVNLLRRVLGRFRERFGNRGVRVFRSPGRINLRGMHVDTHGGYLNLMTHQRETVVAVSPAAGSRCQFSNTDASFEPASFEVPSASASPVQGSWSALLPALDALDGGFPRGHWGRYLSGCAFRVRHAAPAKELRGLDGVVGSDLPRGAALSSSAALCVAVVSAFAGCNEVTLDPAERILSARDAEWYAGSRCGVSDQTAMVLGGPGEWRATLAASVRIDWRSPANVTSSFRTHYACW